MCVFVCIHAITLNEMSWELYSSPTRPSVAHGRILTLCGLKKTNLVNSYRNMNLNLHCYDPSVQFREAFRFV